MTTEAQSSNLVRARVNKQDEFYTQLSDVEDEVKHYRKHFKGKTVYLNCDDPRSSAFFHYFSYNFEKLDLKKLIATCYTTKEDERAVFLEYEGDKNGDLVPNDSEIEVNYLEGNGDFRSAEAVELLEQADIVVTNPPFSLFREYVAQLVEYDKKFLIIGSLNAVTYKGVFPLMQQKKMWLGSNYGKMDFRVPDHYMPRKTGFWIDDDGQKWRGVGPICWFTNLELRKRHEDLILYKEYSSGEYPAYDNFEAIEVSKVADIPKDYSGVMGVPITYLTKHSPDQFEIVGISKAWWGMASKTYPTHIQVSPNGKKSNVKTLNRGPAMKVSSPPKGKTYYMVDGEYFMNLYQRIFIRNKKVER